MDWHIINSITEIAEENVIIIENEVIRILRSSLEERAHNIESVALTNQRGIDLLTSKDGSKFVFECKGTKTDLRQGNIFNGTQNEIHFGEAIVQALRRYSEIGSAVYNVVFPVHSDFIRIINQMGLFVNRLPVNIVFIGNKSIYEIRNGGAVAS